MAVNRFAHLLAEPDKAVQQPASLPVGFALCPIFIVQLQSVTQLGMQELYRRAYEQAQAQARAAQRERRFFSVWN